MEKKKRISNQVERNVFFENHVLDYFENDPEKLFCQVAYMQYHNRGTLISRIQYAAHEIVMGGCLLVYYHDMEDLRKENPGCIDRRYTNENAWEIYVKQCTNAIVRIVRRFEVKPGDVYRIADATMYEKFIDHHGNGNGMDDLYIKKTPVSDFIVSAMKNTALLETFVSCDGDIWYDFPFCYPGTVKEEK